MHLSLTFLSCKARNGPDALILLGCPVQTFKIPKPVCQGINRSLFQKKKGLRVKTGFSSKQIEQNLNSEVPVRLIWKRLTQLSSIFSQEILVFPTDWLTAN